MNKKKTLIATIMMTLIIAGFLTILVANAATEDTVEANFTIDSQPDVSGVDFQTDAYGVLTTITPDASTYYRVNFTVATSATLADIINCTIYIFDDSTHGANYDSAPPDGLYLTTFSWNESDDVWAVEDQGSLTGWTVDDTGSDDPGSASPETTFELSMRFQVSKIARPDTDWNVTVHVMDDDDDTDADAETGLVTMASYLEISWDTVTNPFTWGTTLVDGSVNNTHAASLILLIISNTQWEIKVSAVDFTASAESDVDIEANNVLTWDEDGSDGGSSFWIRNTAATCLGTWDDQTPTVEGGVTRNVYIFLTLPSSLFVGGKVWTTTFTFTVQANT